MIKQSSYLRAHLGNASNGSLHPSTRPLSKCTVYVSWLLEQRIHTFYLCLDPFFFPRFPRTSFVSNSSTFLFPSWSYLKRLKNRKTGLNMKITILASSVMSCLVPLMTVLYWLKLFSFKYRNGKQIRFCPLKDWRLYLSKWMLFKLQLYLKYFLIVTFHMNKLNDIFLSKIQQKYKNVFYLLLLDG